MPEIKSITVSQLNNWIHNVFVAEELLHNIVVLGEVSGFKISGPHAYFTLKDSGAAIAVNDFSYRSRYIPKEGEQVFIKCNVDFYAKNGKLSLNVIDIIPNGEGALAVKLAKLKTKLESEGYFDITKKKPLPPYPKRVAVITSKTGAVIRDIITTTRRYNPIIDLVIYDCRVQGEGAEKELANAIKIVDELHYDCIIIARGGGSLEDLLPFNTEEIVHAIYNAKTPIISAVGHETDFTFSDFAADVRAATPTAAAELVAYSVIDLQQYYLDIINKLNKLLLNKIDLATKNYTISYTKLKNSFNNYYLNNMNYAKNQLTKMNNCIDNILRTSQFNLEKLITKLDLTNPTTIFKKGYMFTQINDKIVKSIKDVSVGDQVNLKSYDGEAVAKILEVKNDI